MCPLLMWAENGGLELCFPGGWVSTVSADGTVLMQKQAVDEPEPEPESIPAPQPGLMLPAPAVSAPDLLAGGTELQTAATDPFVMVEAPAPAPPTTAAGGFDLLGGAPAPAQPAAGGFDLLGAPAPAPPAGGFDLLGGAPAAAPAPAGGLDLLGAVAPPPVGSDGLLGASGTAAPAVADPFDLVQTPNTPSMSPPDPFGMTGAGSPPADPFGLSAVAPAPAPAVVPSGGADPLGILGEQPQALPPGWEKRVSKKYAGKTFYYHAATNTTTWEVPDESTAPAPAPAPAEKASPKEGKRRGMGGMMGKAKAAAEKAKAAAEQAAVQAAQLGVSPDSPRKDAEPPLPAGWEKRESSKYPGKFFYFQASTNTTSWERPPPDASPPAAEGADLLGMFAPAPGPAPAPLGLPPSSTAPQPTQASASPKASPRGASPRGDSAARLPSRAGQVKKQAGVRKVWQPRYLKLDEAILSWSVYESDRVERGRVALSSGWRVAPDEAQSGCSPADVDGRGSFARMGSIASRGPSDSVFMVHKVSDHQNRFFFDAGTDELRKQWIDDIQASIDAAPAPASPKAAADEAPLTAKSGAKKAGKFMKGMRKQMQAAAISAASGMESSGADFDEEEEPVFALACRPRKGLLSKESTGMLHEWQERLFVLSDAGQLHYYKPDADMDDPQGRIPLGPRWRVAASWQEGHPHSLKVWNGTTAASSSSRGECYFLAAKDEDEQHGWIEAIHAAILSLRFGQMDAEEALLQRAMMRVYKQQKDAQMLPYQPMAVAEYGLDELCYTQAVTALEGFVDHYLKTQPAEIQSTAREALEHAILAIVEAECDSAWRSWEKTTAQLYQHAEALQTHPGTMDALLQHENRAQEQLQAAIQGSLSTLCTRDLVPGVKRVLAAQAKPFGELVRSLVPHAVTARAMLTKVVQCGACPATANLQALIDGVQASVKAWATTVSREGDTDTIVGLLENDVIPSLGKSLLAMLEWVDPPVLANAILEGVEGLDEVEEVVSTLRDPSQASDLCERVLEDDVGQRFESELRRLAGMSMLRQQNAVSGANADLTVQLSWGLNSALLNCMVDAATAFFHRMCAHPSTHPSTHVFSFGSAEMICLSQLGQAGDGQCRRCKAPCPLPGIPLLGAPPPIPPWQFNRRVTMMRHAVATAAGASRAGGARGARSGRCRGDSLRPQGPHRTQRL